jgi:hypothetical protein
MMDIPLNISTMLERAEMFFPKNKLFLVQKAGLCAIHIKKLVREQEGWPAR